MCPEKGFICRVPPGSGLEWFRFADRAVKVRQIELNNDGKAKLIIFLFYYTIILEIGQSLLKGVLDAQGGRINEGQMYVYDDVRR